MKPILILHERAATSSFTNFSLQTELASLWALGIPFEQKMAISGFTRQAYGDKYSAVIIPLLEMPTSNRDVIATWLDGNIPAVVLNARNAVDFSGYTAGVTALSYVSSSQYINCVLSDIDGKQIGNIIVYGVNSTHRPYSIASSYAKPIAVDPTDPSKVWAWIWMKGKYPVVYYAGTANTTPYLLYLLKLMNAPVSIPIGIDMDDADAAEVSYNVDTTKITAVIDRAIRLGGYVLCGFKSTGVAGMPSALKRVYASRPNGVVSIVHGHLDNNNEYWWNEKTITLTHGVWGAKNYDTTITGAKGTSAANPGSGKLGAFSYEVAHLKAQGWLPNVIETQHYGGYCFLPNNAYSIAGLRALKSDGVMAVRGSGGAVGALSFHPSSPAVRAMIHFADDSGKGTLIYSIPAMPTNSLTAPSDIYGGTLGFLPTMLQNRAVSHVFFHAQNLTNDSNGAARLNSINVWLDVVELCQPVLRLYRIGERWRPL